MNTKKIGTLAGSLFLMLSLVGFFAPSTNASTISVGSAFVAELGATTVVDITLDSAPGGLSGYIITVSLSDPSKAEITAVEFPSWATLTDESLSGASVWMKAVDLTQKVEAGDNDINLGTITIRGDAVGKCEIDVAIGRVDNDSGYPVNPSVSPGTLTIGQYHLTISSTAGGSVAAPGEGVFAYAPGEEVRLVATPEVDYRFTEWSGDIGTVEDINAASTTITMNGDYSITANFAGARSPDISVSEIWIDFGDITVGSSSSAQTVTVYNDGTADLHVGTIGIDGIDADEFSIQSDTCSGETIFPGGSATLEVLFSPNSTGGKFADLSIPSDDPDESTVTVSLSGKGFIASPATVALTADPINLLADGASTSALTAEVKDAEGQSVADGTTVSFTADRGTVTSITTTINGVATATLIAPKEPGICIVRAQAASVSDYTAVFFKEPGQPDIVAAKTGPTRPGTDTVDARVEANTTVTKSGVGTPTITIARYDENPGGSDITAFAGGYIAVHLDDTANVDEVTFCVYYPPTSDESNVRLYWWDEATSAWVLASAQTTDTGDLDGYGGKVCVTVRATGTISTLDDLDGTVLFAGVDEAK